MKKFLSLFLSISLAFSVAACSAPAAGTGSAAPATAQESESIQSETVSEPETDTSETAAYYPITVTDQAGREVTLESEPKKLVSGYYITTSLLIGLGLDDKLVGLESKPEKRPIYALSSPDLLTLPTVGSIKEFDLEGCASLEPDLVILPLKLKEAAAALEELGITVLLVNPESDKLITEMISLVGAAANQNEKAAELVSFIEDRQDNLNKLMADQEKPSVYITSNSNFLSTAGDAMYQSSMIRLAGGANVASDITDTYWAEISYEQLLSWDPEYIILSSDASFSVEEVMADPNLADCSAVKNAKVYQIPNIAESWDSPVPASILGSVWLAGVLHPDVITEEETASIIDQYYETFYGFTYSEK